MFGEYLRHRYGEDVCYDSNAFAKVDKLRKLELDVIDASIRYDNSCRFSKYRGVKNRLLRSMFQAHPRHHFIQEGQQMPQRFLPDHIYYMQGYWQGYEYYQALNECQPGFTIKSKKFPGELNSIRKAIIEQPDTVSIHIRRGDYFSPQNIKTYGVCTESYYNEAIGIILRNHPNTTPFIFSDDLEWVRQHLELSSNAVIVPNYDVSQFAYIELMSMCRHHIISNSSFSWWGAVVGGREDAMVIAPSQWTKNSDSTLALDKWMKIAV